MAILRGGTRIFGQDIRIGIPRDKSLVNVAGDKRLKRRPGNVGSTIGQFIAAINQGEGVARPTRYLVRFFLNKNLTIGDFGSQVITDPAIPPEAQSRDYYTQREVRQNVEMMCNKVTMPSRDLLTAPHITYGPKREIPLAYTFNGTIECQFYGDKFLRQRTFFEKWQEGIFNEDTHHLKYYDDYVGHMDIYQLGASGGENDRDRITYAVRLEECYPEIIGSYDYSYGATNELINLPITLRYRMWRNLTKKDINLATVGKSTGDIPTIKAAKNFGLFGGLLSKLPPELQRAGKQVLEAGRRNLPIGRVTGGKVTPPFPPLT
tara:strand:- start:373 stop:1332 length:960 start_codon:yes stop_codon:yes gene_type:complete